MTITPAGAARPRIDAPEAVMDGLRLLRREPRTWLAWGAVSLAFSLLVSVSLLVVSGPAFTALANAGARPDPAVVGAAMLGALPGWLLTMVLSLVFYAVFYAAMNRALLRPAEGGWFHLRLGADELRQGLLFILLWLLFAALYLAVVIVAAVTIGVVGVVGAVSARGAVGSGSALVIGLLVGVLVLAMLLGMLFLFVWVGVRLSLASALTFDTGQVRVFGSWRLTKGVFWPLFGAYLLAFVIMALIGVATLVVSSGVALATGGLAAVSGNVLRADMSSVAAYFTPARLVQLLVGGAVYPPFLALLAGAPASAYAQIVQSGAAVPGGRFGDARAEVFGPVA